MARIRSIKPEFWLDRKLARKLTRDERMLYMGLWNQADEHGRALGDPVVVKGQVFPYDDDLSVEVIGRMLGRLDESGVVQGYEVDGDPYLFLPKLAVHQRLEPHKSRSKHPEPPPRGGYPQPDSETVVDAAAQTPGAATTFSESGNGSATSVPDQREESNPGDAAIFSDESAQRPGKKSLLYGTGSMEQGVRGADFLAQTSEPPPLRCPDHLHHPNPPACGRCADARREREQFDAEANRARIAQQSAEKRRAAEDRARAIANCGMCDADGYLTVDGAGALCSHDPDEAERGTRGMANLRATMGWAS